MDVCEFLGWTVDLFFISDSLFKYYFTLRTEKLNKIDQSAIMGKPEFTLWPNEKGVLVIKMGKQEQTKSTDRSTNESRLETRRFRQRTTRRSQGQK